ncbi:hypothetical protein C2G38_2170413 [Gigaspora rosea]|uniref:Uncharacterized protein n=1 Tax=Gigaspora rosea TaxID=44941 RepID=A0A397VRV1_9GLOM|nr:hypothetical protein C2G38_2170413 [Gigaspora rosea]
MASKIFMGDMPELMENILNNLKNELNSLYSCSLVSRHWCKMSIPILWQNPFSFYPKPLYISEYFSSLDEDEIYILKEYGINLEISRKLFNYAKFLKDLNLSNLEFIARKWTSLNLVEPISSRIYLDVLVNIVINLLLKLIFESGTILHKLVLSFSELFEFKPEIFYSIGRNELFFSRLQHLSLSVIPEFNTENVTIFLKVLAKNITTISSLNLEICSDFKPELFHSLFHHIIRIIKSQDQLKLFGLDGGDHYLTELHGIISALECQKNSLQKVIIKECAYSKDTLEIVDCAIDVHTMPLILEKYGLLIQRLRFNSKNSDDFDEELFFLKAFKSFCPNITYLYISNIEFSIQLLELIGSLQRLQFLSLRRYFATMSTMSRHFPQSLQRTLKKLLIYRLDDEKDTRALIEFCIRNKSLNYVGVYIYSDLNENFRKEAETHDANVVLVPSSRIIVNC